MEMSIDFGLETDSVTCGSILEKDRRSRSERGAADEGKMRVDDGKLRFQID